MKYLGNKRTHSMTARQYASRVLFPIPDDIPDWEWFDIVQFEIEARSERCLRRGNYVSRRFFDAVRLWVIRMERRHVYDWRE